MMDDFAPAVVETGETSIFLRSYGSGPPILLLHGFPQTHLMWRGVAPLLARKFTIVCADLRGYGRSGCPVSTPDHAPYAKRAIAQDMVTVMERLGFPRFAVAGHDRGGRVAYRMALDHPDRIERLAALDTPLTWRRCAIRPMHTPSARSIEPPRRSIASMTKWIAQTNGGSRVLFSLCGARRAQSIPGTQRSPHPSRSGGAGAMTFKVSRSAPNTFSRKRLRNKPPTRWSASSATPNRQANRQSALESECVAE